MYVDDIIGVCFAEDLESDLAATRGIWTALLGSGAVADDKTETRMRLDIICVLHNLLAYYEGTRRAELFPHRTTWIHQHGCRGENQPARGPASCVVGYAGYAPFGKICRVVRAFWDGVPCNVRT
jgi:hypothetical protein